MQARSKISIGRSRSCRSTSWSYPSRRRTSRCRPKRARSRPTRFSSSSRTSARSTCSPLHRRSSSQSASNVAITVRSRRWSRPTCVAWSRSRSAQTPVSLEKPVGDEEESEFGHFLTDENVPLPDEAAEVSMRKETLQKILSTLSHRERRVLELRYGLDGEHPRTLDEVGRTFNVTRERIRQIENQSLKKLRALADSL